MAPVRTGSPSSFTSNANSGTTSITVPSDATLAVLAVCGYDTVGVANYFSGGTGPTLNSVNPTGTVACDGNTAMLLGAMWYWTSPATGSRTVAWDFVGTNTSGAGFLFTYAFYKDLDTASPVRSSSGGQQAANPHTSGTLTCQSDDLIVISCEQSVGSEQTFTWSGSGVTPTEIAEFTQFNTADSAWAEASPTGNQTVTGTCSSSSDGGIMAIVLKPATAVTPDLGSRAPTYQHPKPPWEQLYDIGARV